MQERVFRVQDMSRQHRRAKWWVPMADGAGLQQVGHLQHIAGDFEAGEERRGVEAMGMGDTCGGVPVVAGGWCQWRLGSARAGDGLSNDSKASGRGGKRAGIFGEGCSEEQTGSGPAIEEG